MNSKFNFDPRDSMKMAFEKCLTVSRIEKTPKNEEENWYDDSSILKSDIHPNELDIFGLYDCFPITFVCALEAMGLCNYGEGIHLIKSEVQKCQNSSDYTSPFNTHGGLLGFGAPGDSPSIFRLFIQDFIYQISHYF